MTQLWQTRDAPLKFGVGDWVAFSVPLRLHARSVRLSERLTPVADPGPPGAPQLGETSGYMLRAMPVATALPVLKKSNDFLRYVTLQYVHCFIDLSIGQQAYRDKFSAKTRATIMRKLRKYQEHCGGTLAWHTYRTADAMPEFHRLARQVAAKTYQERLLEAGIPADPSFVREMIDLAAKDQARGWILFDGERPVSYLYCPALDGVLTYAYLGYDPDYMKLSVGTVLQWLAVEQLLEERRFDFFDFTEGESEHKRLFATHELRCANMLFLRHSLSLAILVRLHVTIDQISAAAGRLAERWGVKSRLRRMIRFGVRGLR